MSKLPVKTGTCKRCRQPINLIPWGASFKWVTGYGTRVNWRCMPTREFPVRAHDPGEAENGT